MFKDYYRILQVDRSASLRDIKTAYRMLAFRWHPDVNQDSDSTQRMQLINEAYLILGNIESRTRYDTEYDLFEAWREIEVSRPTASAATSDSGYCDNKDIFDKYVVQDDILTDWINQAIKRAKTLGRQAIDDATGMLQEAAKSALDYILWGIVLFAVMFILLLYAAR